MSISRGLRFRILERDRFACQYCGRIGGELEVDHIHPRSEGGSDKPHNLITACYDCNQGKRHHPLSRRGLDALIARYLSDDIAEDENFRATLISSLERAWFDGWAAAWDAIGLETRQWSEGRRELFVDRELRELL